MCLTEPHAGSDVGSAKTQRAAAGQTASYTIKGTKVFISGGDHDLADNIVHLVLARVEGAPPGTKGLSLFIVPKNRISADGTVGASNDVSVGSIEHKMGINGSATCVLNFGENDGCEGELVGTVENLGMSQMFRMMNGARIAVGHPGRWPSASAAYQNALDYAKDRKQGAHLHPLEGSRRRRGSRSSSTPTCAGCCWTSSHTPRASARSSSSWPGTETRRGRWPGKDDEKATYHKGQVDLLTPLVKSFASDEAFRLCGAGDPGLRRRRLPQGPPGGAVRARREDLQHLRGHQPHPGDGPGGPEDGPGGRGELPGRSSRTWPASWRHTAETRRSARRSSCSLRGRRRSCRAR